MKNGGVLVLVAILLSTVISCNRDKKKEEPTEKTEMVRHGEFVVKIRETGSLEPRLFVEVKSNVSGQVKQLFVKEGDYVEKDQELLKLTMIRFSNERNRLKPDLNLAKRQ